MTPQLQQAIKLLQLSNLDLADFVTEEIEKNPLLAEGEPDLSLPGEDRGGEGGGTASEDGLREKYDDTGLSGESNVGDMGPQDGLISADQPLDTGFDTGAGGESALDTDLSSDVYHHDSAADNGAAGGDVAPSSGSLSLDGISGKGGSFSDGEMSFEQTLTEDQTLAEFLNDQMLILLHHPSDRLVASHLIDLVDEAGYLADGATADVADRLGVDEDEVEEILTELHGLEPTGVFARSLSECLSLQLAEQDRLDPCMAILLENLHLLGNHDFASLKKLCDADDEDLAEMISDIKSLNPKPGLAFGGGDATPVVPDVFVRKSRAGTWTVELNSDTLPRVLVNSQYMAELTETANGKETKAFLSDCLSNANWLVKALDQRARTILKVSMALVTRQDMFFEHGIRFLKPMTLKDIADEIDMHESTVSRVTSNKFLACPRGLFELKYFFTSAINATHGGEALSAESVKFRIKELIDGEDPKKILSDDKLVAMMKAEGIDIARRTVAKYREALKIPSSVQRRRIKNSVA